MFSLALPFCAVLAAGTPIQHLVGPAQGARYAIAQGKGSAELLLNATTGAKEAALNVLRLGPGAQVPEHVHETSAELLYVLRGQVRMSIAGSTLTARAGDAIYIPPNTKHSAQVPVDVETLEAVQVYVGPGPEQRFTQGPKLK